MDLWPCVLEAKFASSCWAFGLRRAKYLQSQRPMQTTWGPSNPERLQQHKPDLNATAPALDAADAAAVVAAAVAAADAAAAVAAALAAATALSLSGGVAAVGGVVSAALVLLLRLFCAYRHLIGGGRRGPSSFR